MIGSEVNVDWGEGDVAGFDDADVGVGGVVEQVEIAVEPVVAVATRVEMFGKFFDEAGASHTGGLHAAQFGERKVGNIDVEQGALRQRVFDYLFDNISSDFCGGFPVRVLVGA